MIDQPRSPRYHSTSVARALTILELFEPETPSLSASQIARSLRVRPGSLYPALSTLERFGYLERRPDKRFRLGLKLLERGHTILLHPDMYERAKPALRELAQALSANAHLAVLYQGKVLYLGREEAAPSAVFPSIVGRLAPAHCTALGKVLLAHLALGERRPLLAGRPLERWTARTITGLRRLERELAGVRGRGYAVDDEELHDGVMCVAAPVRDHAGKVVAAISVSLLKTRVTESRQHKIAQEVVRTAAIISGAMGYRPTRGGGPDGLRKRGDRGSVDAPTLHGMPGGGAPVSMSGGRRALVRESL
jgi:DNA-binding IclR family transcriptional regulator